MSLTFQNRVLVFEGNADFTVEQMTQFLYDEYIGDVLRMDCFELENKNSYNVFTYVVYFKKIYKNAFTKHLFKYLYF